MRSNPFPRRGSAPPPGWDDAWIPLFAYLFVILALVGLAAAPAVLLQRMNRVNDGIVDIVLPMYDGMSEFSSAVEERISSSRSRMLTQDPVYDERLLRARTAEAEALRTLEALAPLLGDGAEEYVASLREHTVRRDSVESLVLGGNISLENYRMALPRFDALRDSMRVDLVGLERELTRVAGARLAEERRWSTLQRRFSVLLGAVALLAALLVGWFGLQQRRLQMRLQGALAEANRARAEAERRGLELERASEARVRLLRGITHDVKNPLGAAKGYVELLEMGIKAPMLPEQAPMLAGVKRSVDGALAIIADLLDVARADSGGLSVDRVEVDLREVARRAAEDHRAEAEAAGHALHLDLPAEPLRLHTDPARVAQVLGNLVSNAVKYTPPPGRITVHTVLDGSRAAIRVVDTGPGIPPEMREAVFDEFTRLEDRGTKAGHGLGLAIARRVARLLGGDLTVEEGEGGGAAFVLWLPLRAPDAR